MLHGWRYNHFCRLKITQHGIHFCSLNEEALIEAIDVCSAAVKAGELDKAIAGGGGDQKQAPLEPTCIVREKGYAWYQGKEMKLSISQEKSYTKVTRNNIAKSYKE